MTTLDPLDTIAATSSTTVGSPTMMKADTVTAMKALLSLAHERTCEAALAAAIESCLEAGTLPDPDVLATQFAPAPDRVPDIHVKLCSLTDYDVLLTAPTAASATAGTGDGS